MKFIHKLSALVLSAALLTLSLAGCGANPSASSSSGSSAAGSTAKLKIGVIQYAVHPSLDNCYTGFVKGLEAAGYKNGDNITIDFQNAQASTETSDQVAKNMVAKNYDMIVAIATPSAMSAYAAASGTNIPVVFCAVSDPVSAKLVKSLDKSGNNCTGTSDRLNLDAQLKMIRALQPNAKKIGILYTTSEANSVSQLAQIKKLAPNYGFTIVEQGVQNASDIPQAAASLASKVDCLNNFTDNNVVDNLGVELQKAKDAGIPVYGSEIEQVKKGCLASESLDYVSLGEQTGALAASILKGTKAADTAVVLVKDSKPVINTDVLASFKLTVPSAYSSAEKVTTSK